MPSTNYNFSAIFALILALAIWRFEPFKKPSRIKCYQRIDTLSLANDSFNCIHASSRSGQVIQLFNHSSDSGSSGSDAWNVSSGYVIPGLWDGHAHVLQYGEMLSSVKLYGVGSVDGMICSSTVRFIFILIAVLESKTRIKEYLRKNPTHGSKEKWIRGIGWDQANFGGVMPVAVLILMLFAHPVGDVVFAYEVVCVAVCAFMMVTRNNSVEIRSYLGYISCWIELMVTAFGFLVCLSHTPSPLYHPSLFLLTRQWIETVFVR